MDHVVHGMPMTLDTNEAIQRLMAAGTYEPVETGWVRQHLEPGSVFVDVGANFGWFTSLALSLVGAGGRVIAFEPSHVAFDTLTRNLGGFRNALLVNAAVGREPGELTVYLPVDPALHSPSAFVSPGDFKPYKVPMVSLDAFEPLVALPKIDFVKIDVEGSEPDVLEGMTGLIRAGKVQRVMCEFNSWWLNANNTTVDHLAERFHSLGFVIETATEWQRGLPASGGGTFDLQDVLYRYRG